MNTKTFAQLAIERLIQRKMQPAFAQNYWTEYSESYDDYNDCHGDYYDNE